jgi:hypothetical protein
VTIHLGKFLQSTARIPLAVPKPGGAKTVEVLKTEEKGSDVNLATYLLIDAFRHDSDIAVVVSNDSDLCEPIRIVKDEFQVRRRACSEATERVRRRGLAPMRTTGEDWRLLKILRHAVHAR